MFSKPLADCSIKELRQIKKLVTAEIRSRNKDKKKQPNLRFFWLYVLLLENGKYYVGITRQKVENRYKEHLSGKGAKWTKAHKPIGILETAKLGFMTESQATVYEREKTHEMIGLYGQKNVRGGDLCYMSQKRMEKMLEESYKKLEKIKNKADLMRSK